MWSFLFLPDSGEAIRKEISEKSGMSVNRVVASILERNLWKSKETNRIILTSKLHLLEMLQEAIE
jgi:hypothetical protein